MDFVKTAANVSFEALHNFKKFENDVTLKDIDFVELIAKVREAYVLRFFEQFTSFRCIHHFLGR